MQDAEAGRLFEACNVYKINGSNKYLALIEAFDKTSDYRRYFRSWTADSLEGPWTVLHDDATSPFAGKLNVSFDGAAWTDDISHGEMIRAGYDETMAIDGAGAALPLSGVRAVGEHQRLQRDPVAARPAHAEVRRGRRRYRRRDPRRARSANTSIAAPNPSSTMPQPRFTLMPSERAS